jgi:hypothetical protein
MDTLRHGAGGIIKIQIKRRGTSCRDKILVTENECCPVVKIPRIQYKDNRNVIGFKDW